MACDLTSSCQRDGELAPPFRKAIGIEGMPVSCYSIELIAKVIIQPSRSSRPVSDKMDLSVRHCGTISLTGGHVASFSAGPDGLLYVLVCTAEPDRNRIKREQACDWRVLAFHPDGRSSEILIQNQKDNLDLVQPLQNGLLLGNRRCKYAGEATEANGCLFDSRGQLVRRLLLGDGIADLQTTTSDEIWVSYFDEGVFGNFGWRKPIGKAGLVRFNLDGNICYRFKTVAGLGPIDDCYCLNVVSEREAWCYYYSQFSIVQIRDDHIAHYWDSPVKGSSGFAVCGNSLAMQDGYESDDWRLLEVTGADVAVAEEAITFRTPEGLPLAAKSARARGSVIWFVVGEDIYRFDLKSDLSR